MNTKELLEYYDDPIRQEKWNRSLMELELMEAREKAKYNMIVSFYKQKVPLEIIAKASEFPLTKVKEIIDNYQIKPI